MRTVLILVRHGETDTNAEGRLHGDKDSQSLNKVGRAQIQKAAKELLKYNPAAIYSSQEARAIESAKIIARVCQTPVHPMDSLQERHWGDFSGKTWPEIAGVLNKMALEERYSYIPPNGESWKNFATRLKKAACQIVAKNKGKVIIVVTHGGAIRALLPFLLGVPKEESFKHDPPNASITIFEHFGNRFNEVKVSDVAHL